MKIKAGKYTSNQLNQRIEWGNRECRESQIFQAPQATSLILHFSFLLGSRSRRCRERRKTELPIGRCWDQRGEAGGRKRKPREAEVRTSVRGSLNRVCKSGNIDARLAAVSRGLAIGSLFTSRDICSTVRSLANLHSFQRTSPSAERDRERECTCYFPDCSCRRAHVYTRGKIKFDRDVESVSLSGSGGVSCWIWRASGNWKFKWKVIWLEKDEKLSSRFGQMLSMFESLDILELEIMMRVGMINLISVLL